MKFCLSLLAAFLTAAPAAGIELCSGPKRVTCVVDGDTVWIAGEKIRLSNIDAPASDGRCHEERRLAADSAERLRQLLDGKEIVVTRVGVQPASGDYVQRTLAKLFVEGRDVGAILVAEGLARPWRGHRERWCD